MKTFDALSNRVAEMKVHGSCPPNGTNAHVHDWRLPLKVTGALSVGGRLRRSGGCETPGRGHPPESALKSGLLSEQIARTVDALAALLRVSTLKLSTPVAEPQS
jgi:hypothetical protein